MKEIMEALSNFQDQCPQIVKDKLNPFYKNKYADLDNIWKNIQIPLRKNGFVLCQPCQTIDSESFIIKTILYHIPSGQMLESSISTKTSDPQKIGAIITYFRRYEISALLGIVTEDDTDGNNTVSQHDKQITNSETSSKTNINDNFKIGKISKINISKTKNEKDITYVTVENITYSRWGVPSVPLQIGDVVEIVGITTKTIGDKTFYNANSINLVDDLDMGGN